MENAGEPNYNTGTHRIFRSEVLKKKISYLNTLNKTIH